MFHPRSSRRVGSWLNPPQCQWRPLHRSRGPSGSTGVPESFIALQPRPLPGTSSCAASLWPAGPGSREHPGGLTRRRHRKHHRKHHPSLGPALSFHQDPHSVSACHPPGRSSSGGKPLPSVDLYRPISGRSDGRGFNPSRPFHRHVFRSCRHRSFQRREGSQEPGGRERFCTGTREIPPPGVCPASIFHRPTCALDDPSAQF